MRPGLDGTLEAAAFSLVDEAAESLSLVEEVAAVVSLVDEAVEEQLLLLRCNDGELPEIQINIYLRTLRIPVYEYPVQVYQLLTKLLVYKPSVTEKKIFIPS
jgi:hypothetical protein